VQPAFLYQLKAGRIDRDSCLALAVAKKDSWTQGIGMGQSSLESLAVIRRETDSLPFEAV
jgi:hypothetical protein